MYHQHAILRLVQRLAREEGLAVAAAVHDINLAARYCDRLAVLKDGQIVAVGSPATTLTPALLADVFAVEAEVIPESYEAGAVRVNVLGPSVDDVREPARKMMHVHAQ